MSFQTRVFDLITTVRNDLRDIQTQVSALQVTAGGAATPSSETSLGVIELATQAEVNAGSDNTRVNNSS